MPAGWSAVPPAGDLNCGFFPSVDQAGSRRATKKQPAADMDCKTGTSSRISYLRSLTPAWTPITAAPRLAAGQPVCGKCRSSAVAAAAPANRPPGMREPGCPRHRPALGGLGLGRVRDMEPVTDSASCACGSIVRSLDLAHRFEFTFTPSRGASRPLVEMRRSRVPTRISAGDASFEGAVEGRHAR